MHTTYSAHRRTAQATCTAMSMCVCVRTKHRRALRTYEWMEMRSHPQALQVLNNLAQALMRQRRFTEAAECSSECVQAAQQPDSRVVGADRCNYVGTRGLLRKAMGDTDEGNVDLDTALHVRSPAHLSRRLPPPLPLPPPLQLDMSTASNASNHATLHTPGLLGHTGLARAGLLGHPPMVRHVRRQEEAGCAG